MVLSGSAARTRDTDVDVEVADTYLRRLRGMLGREVLPEALLLVPGGGVHGVGMRVPLDVAMLGRGGGAGRYRVLKVARLRPFGLVNGARGTVAVLEAAAGSLERWGTAVGDEIELVEPGTRPRQG